MQAWAFEKVGINEQPGNAHLCKSANQIRELFKSPLLLSRPLLQLFQFPIRNIAKTLKAEWPANREL
jgi:hypothetical protein